MMEKNNAKMFEVFLYFGMYWLFDVKKAKPRRESSLTQEEGGWTLGAFEKDRTINSRIHKEMETNMSNGTSQSICLTITSTEGQSLVTGSPSVEVLCFWPRINLFFQAFLPHMDAEPGPFHCNLVFLWKFSSFAPEQTMYLQDHQYQSQVCIWASLPVCFCLFLSTAPKIGLWIWFMKNLL